MPLYSVRIGRQSIVYLLLVFALLNATLRFGESGITSLYRIISPLVCIAIILKYYRQFSSYILWFLGLLLYSIFASVSSYATIDFKHLAFYVYIFYIIILVKYLSLLDSNFKYNFFNFLNLVTYLSIVAGWFQFFFRFSLPYISIPAYNGVNLFMSNENELGEAFACMLLIYTYLIIFFRKYTYILPCANILFFLYTGDVKLSLLGYFTGCIFILYYFVWIKFFSKISITFYSLCGLIFFIIFLFIMYFWNPIIGFRNYDISLNELIFEPLLLLLTGNEMYSIGSINDRLNAIIYGLRELKNSYCIGIGLGNSVYMLQLSQYKLMFAESMHNAFFQFLVEFGVLGMIVYYKIFKKILLGFRSDPRSSELLFQSIFFIAFIIISSQSSIGIMSNYYTIMIVCFVCLLNNDKSSAVNI